MMLDLASVKRQHAALLSQTNAAIRVELVRAGKRAEQHTATHHVGFKPRSGTKGLARATRSQVVRLTSGYLLKVSNPKKYAAAIDRGSKPHEIRARRAPFLVFMWRGQLRRFRRVWHPGTRPTRFLWRATFAAYRTTGPSLEQRLQGICKRL